ncbi:MAG TPA: neutral zinc metallopeptidase [Candidatus Limnocylindrales bacterium]|nr:neutral zinc metallopeptidase [Candidatus Limnocylindrales bacterium]
MTFDPNAQLDPSQVTDARGGGGGRLGGRGGMVVGGGGIGSLVILVVYLLLGGNVGDLLNGGSGTGTGPDTNAPDSSALAQCKTGTDANNREDCQIVGYVNSIQAFWATQIQNYEKADTVLFTDATDTGCGSATSSTGPFYCPVDKNVYLDLGFFQELQDRFGAKDAPFARAYVLAHEYGHHVQDLLNDLQPGSDTGAESRSVRTELQADCYAGVWAHNAASTGFLQPLTADQIAAADAAAKAVGDDHIQQQSQGGVDPDSFTHGTSEQRVRWFTTGYDSGDPRDCDTFNATNL